MDILMGILKAAGMVGAVGIFVGVFLGVAAIWFKVKVDEKEEAILGILPGNNCGGCSVRFSYGKTLPGNEGDGWNFRT